VKTLVARWAPWVAGAVLVAGVVTYATTRWLTDGSSSAPQTQHQVPLEAAERQTVLDFIHTAVARKNLAKAWDIVGTELKQNMSLAEWMTGTIPVIPYPVAEADPVPAVVFSYADFARFHVTFVPHAGTKAQPQSFTLDLRKRGGRWLVTAWGPAQAIRPHKGGG
jgi:hypothetical protein